ncbi:MAG: phosphate ABC transporter ATP-binding protein [Dehalococcoidales bacterium]|nr:phosphate ABC transporter ATP-binding protein [Dehalococcoidales bacterium]
MDPKMETRKLNLFYQKNHVLKDVNMMVRENQITSIIGPSGCGKSSLLRTFDRMTDITPGARVEGEALLDGNSIFDPLLNIVDLRKRVGMVFQQPNPFPKSIFENVAFGPRMLGMSHKINLEETIEKSLRSAALWDEVKDDLDKSGLALSGGQQQRLCIARVLAIEPEVILMDEPCSALDPISTLKIEELMEELKKKYTIVIVTHNMQQAARVSDWCGFMLLGELVEYDETKQLFSRPADKRTEDYITGRFG